MDAECGDTVTIQAAATLQRTDTPADFRVAAQMILVERAWTGRRTVGICWWFAPVGRRRNKPAQEKLPHRAVQHNDK